MQETAGLCVLIIALAGVLAFNSVVQFVISRRQLKGWEEVRKVIRSTTEHLQVLGEEPIKRMENLGKETDKKLEDLGKEAVKKIEDYGKEAV